MRDPSARKPMTEGAASPPVASEGSVEVTKANEPGLYRVWLEGAFPTGWAGALALGLARAHIVVVDATARRNASRRWIAAFKVRPETETADPEAIPYLALARSRQPLGAAAPILLLDFALQEDRSGALLLEVRGQDRTGFLGSLLDRLAALALFPEEMTVATEGALAVDRFALRGLGGHAPSAEAREALRRMLEDLMGSS
jgi:hypothetical protein